MSSHKVILVVLSPAAYAHQGHAIATKDEYEPLFVHAHNYECVMGLDVEAVIFIGQIDDETKAKFKSRIRE